MERQCLWGCGGGLMERQMGEGGGSRAGIHQIFKV